MNATGLLKYVVLEGEDALIFPAAPSTLSHRDVVPANRKPVSAGFCMILGAQVKVLPEPSESLHLGPRPKDEPLLQRTLFSL